MKNMIRMGLLAGAVVTSVAAQAQNAWTDKVTLGGDLRFRLNNVQDKGATAGSSTDATFTNNQIRARITASAKVNDAMTANIRIATDPGTNSAVSSNHTFDQSKKAPIALDLAYGDWRVMPGMVVSLGKAPNPFWQAGKNEMIWDADLAFDGVSAKWAADMNTFKPFVNLTYDTVQQIQAAGTAGGNANLLGAQVGTSLGLGSTMNLTAAVGYHNFIHSDVIVGKPKDVKLLDVTAELGLGMVQNIPMSIYADWVTNQGAVVKTEDKGFLAGIKAGQFSNVGTWEAWYNYRDVQAEAVFSGIADSEFAGGTNVDVQGHQVGAGYMAWDNTTVGLNYWNTKRVAGATAGTYDRWTADLVWKF